jgi:uncharacterized protein YbjT (DUF2867 family)
MKIILFGASGMIGQGVLRECLLDPDVTEILAVSRAPLAPPPQEKLREIVRADLLNYAPIEDQLRGYDACLFCLGVSSAGMTEENYRHITYDLTLAAAHTLVRINPASAFLYISGAGTDSTERGRSMWARVKGQTENALLRLPFKGAYMFRPGYIQPFGGIKSRTTWYRALYALISPAYPLLSALFPNYVTTAEQLARAMLHAAKHGARKKILEVADIRRIAPAS